MAIIVSPATTVADLSTTPGTTIQSMVMRDLQERFATGANTELLLDYINRIQRTILRKRAGQWDWMLSLPLRFITEQGQTDYWIGPTAATPVGVVDTGLDLDDVRWVKRGHLLNRSGWTEIFNVAESPNMDAWQFPDGSYAESAPVQYRNDRQSPNIISLYPGPDEGSDYELIPDTPHSTTATGGALSARNYYIRVTFVDAAGGESFASNTARQWVAASKLVTVKAPQPTISTGAAGIAYTHYNVYASTTEGSETLQNVSPTLITADWTEAPTGLTTSGATVPTESSIEPLNGYVMEFRYYRQYTPLAALSDTLLIPDDFLDILVAGVNWLGAQYLHRQGSVENDEIGYWRGVFDEGLRAMTVDQNIWGGRQYIVPDVTAQQIERM